MPEYMDYNDDIYGDNGVNDKKAKRKKRWSNIRLCLSILFLIAVVVLVVVRMPENVRTHFDPVYSSKHKVGEEIKQAENEFVKFNKTFENNQSINFDEQFKKDYPEIASLVRMKKLDIAKERVVSFDKNGYFTIAIVYEVSRQTDPNGNYYDEDKEYIVGTTGVDFYTFKYDTTDGFSFEKPERFSVRLHAGANDLVPFVEKVYVKSESFRLNFYQLSVVIKAEQKIESVSSELLLEDGINKEQYQKNTFVEQQFVKSTDNQVLSDKYEILAGGERGDDYLLTKHLLKTPMEQLEFGIEFDDTLYNKFKSFKVENIKNATYTIKVN